MIHTVDEPPLDIAVKGRVEVDKVSSPGVSEVQPVFLGCVQLLCRDVWPRPAVAGGIQQPLDVNVLSWQKSLGWSVRPSPPSPLPLPSTSAPSPPPPLSPFLRPSGSLGAQHIRHEDVLAWPGIQRHGLCRPATGLHVIHGHIPAACSITRALHIPSKRIRPSRCILPVPGGSDGARPS